ncbi:hypothetical protein [Rufibacter psychrotolerans]|uniref:hypothetical protein n=1 Tax=Rufibacter psychrotolerans TaxID=2812556 RepID=UPI0019688326|nr:hypothetical protein [Rufibacter sp. SYSU D00308]
MKKTFLINLMGLALLAAPLASCGGEDKAAPAEQTGNTNTEDMVEGADGGLDSLDLPADTSTTSGATTGSNM